MRARVLLVDDEPKIRSFLRAYLEADRFEVVEAETGPDALRIARDPSERIALVLLDIGIPGLDGIEVLRHLRTVGDLPVILVTARSEEVDRLVGLAVGADDYMVKPVSPREVVARVKAVLRRTGHPTPGAPAPAALATPAPGDPAPAALAASSPASASAPAQQPQARAMAARSAAAPPMRGPQRLSFAGLVIDLAAREVERDGQDVYLSALEFDVLTLLAGSPGRVFTRAQLLELAWGYEHLGDERVVDVHIRNIRKRLGDDAVRPRFIGTVRGVGYKFLAAPRQAP